MMAMKKASTGHYEVVWIQCPYCNHIFEHSDRRTLTNDMDGMRDDGLWECPECEKTAGIEEVRS